MSLTQLTYVSRARIPAGLEVDTLAAILDSSQGNNRLVGITGYLVYDRMWFFQILEGPDKDVSATFSRIKDDRRHIDVAIVGRRTVKRASFPEWSMGGSIRRPETQAIYARHAIDQSLDPSSLTLPSILALAMDLQDFERMERRALPLAG